MLYCLFYRRGNRPGVECKLPLGSFIQNLSEVHHRSVTQNPYQDIEILTLTTWKAGLNTRAPFAVIGPSKQRRSVPIGSLELLSLSPHQVDAESFAQELS